MKHPFFILALLTSFLFLLSCDENKQNKNTPSKATSNNTSDPKMQYNDNVKITDVVTLYDTGYPEGDGFLHNINMVGGATYAQIKDGLKTGVPTIYFTTNLYCQNQECFRTGVYELNQEGNPGTMNNAYVYYFPKGTLNGEEKIDTMTTGSLTISKQGDIYIIEGELYNEKGDKISLYSEGPLYGIPNSFEAIKKTFINH